ncbi:MAG: sialidase family protein, partial [Ignavibacteriaceae bacterium]|nr:sialidase family protein [Ignavibacteriaceae bacterium]
MNCSKRYFYLFFFLQLVFVLDFTFPQQKDFHKLPLPDIASENSQYRLIQINEQKFLLFTLENYSLIRRESSDAGYTWSNAVKVIEGKAETDRVYWFDAHHVGDNKIYLLFKQPNYYVIYFNVSTDLGMTWGNKKEFSSLYSEKTSFYTTSSGETYLIDGR